MKEQYWKITAQCMVGGLTGMIGSTIGFFLGVNFGPNYETWGLIGIVTGAIIGSIIAFIAFSKTKIESYKNLTIVEAIIALTIIVTAITSHSLVMFDTPKILMIAITTLALSIFFALSLTISMSITIGIFLYKKYIHKS
ncbi:MAG: hypothetical protein NTX63_04445 [Candidatus Peregrinibacteria bacterium]|nr:hypothetical protein [Candidatus Peregrinibacteria bacterium]